MKKGKERREIEIEERKEIWKKEMEGRKQTDITDNRQNKMHKDGM